MQSLGRSTVLLLVSVVVATSCKEDPAETQHRQAIELFAKGDFAKAAAAYDEVYKLNPKLDPEVQKKGAMAWAKAGDFDKATAILERLASQKEGTERLKAYKELAAFSMQPANDLDAAERWFGKVLAETPQDPEALSWMAEIAAIRGGARSAAKPADAAMLDLALQRYDQVIALTPNDVAPHINKRIVMVKYLDYLEKQRVASLADAQANAADKVVAEDFRKKADELSSRASALKGLLEEVNQRIGELNKAAKKK